MAQSEHAKQLDNLLKKSLVRLDDSIIDTMKLAAARAQFQQHKKNEIYKHAAVRVERLIREKIQIENLLKHKI